MTNTDTMPASNVAPPGDTPDSEEKPNASDAAPMSDIDRIKAAHAARRSRRSRPPRPPSSSIIPPPASTSPSPSAADDGDPSSNGASNVDGAAKEGEDSSGSSGVAALKEKHDKEMAALRVEMASLRRNHLQNIKKVSEERDMFASQLAKEQTGSSNTTANSKKLADLEAQLRAARTRNNDLEEENTTLRDEVKQLNFRVQASKTLDAASDGYNKVVDELVEAKLKCAQLQEEKEDLLRINKELTTTSAVLRDANGELEKSRSQWVLQCADVEKQRAQLEERLSSTKDSGQAHPNADTSYTGSDLQELKL